MAAGLVASFLVWNLAEFWEALLAIVVLGSAAAVAAWGSFLSGGVYEPQPRLAKVALAVTLFGGLSVLLFTAKVTLGLWLAGPFDYPYEMDRQGRLFMIHEEAGQRITGVTDLWGAHWTSSRDSGSIRTPLTRSGRRSATRSLSLGAKATATRAGACRSTRTKPRRRTRPGGTSRPAGRFGYDKGLKHLLGSFGPDGFVPPDEQPRHRFDGPPLCQKSLGYVAKAFDPLALATAAYTVDFHKGTVDRLFTAPAGERIRWASKRLDRVNKWNLCYVGTDRAVHFLDLDEGCKELLAVPLAYATATEEINTVGRLANPERYWVWYMPQWHRPLHDQAGSPEARVVVYDRAGRECQPRQEATPRPGVTRITPVIYSDMLIEPSDYQALFGVGTSPVEAAVLVGMTAYLEAESHRRNPTEIPLFLQNLWLTTQAYPWSPVGCAGASGVGVQLCRLDGACLRLLGARLLPAASPLGVFTSPTRELGALRATARPSRSSADDRTFAMARPGRLPRSVASSAWSRATPANTAAPRTPARRRTGPRFSSRPR